MSIGPPGAGTASVWAAFRPRRDWYMQDPVNVNLLNHYADFLIHWVVLQISRVRGEVPMFHVKHFCVNS
jgi:hypothetical protein